ncbi:hypothetical protein [Azospirillum sp. sgz302134]
MIGVQDTQTKAAESTRLRWYKRGVGLLILATVVGFGVYSYANATDGVSYMVGSAMASVLFGWLLAMPFTRGARKPLRSATALTLAFALLFVVNIKRVVETREAKQVVALLKASAGPTDLMRRLEGSGDNKMAAFFKFAAEAFQATVGEMKSLVAGMAPPELDAPFDPATASRDELQRLHKAAKIAETNASAAEGTVDTLYDRERSRVAEYLDKSGLSEHTRRNSLQGLDQRLADYRPYFKRLFALKAEEYRATAQLFAILAKEHGLYKIGPSGQIVFANHNVVQSYNDVAQAMQDIIAAQQAHLKAGEALDARYEAGYQRLTGGK